MGPDSIGSDELDEACGDFRNDWDEGLGEVAEAVGEIEKGLDKSIEGYKQLEEGISASLRKMRDELAASGDPNGGGAV